jgi:hypothetical protein
MPDTLSTIFISSSIHLEPMVGLEPTTSGLQIRFLSSTQSYLRPLRAQIERF